MLRMLLRFWAVVVVGLWLAYISPPSFALCYGLQTQDLPIFLGPVLKFQFFAWLASFFGMPVFALLWWLDKRTPLRLGAGVGLCLVAPSLLLWRPDAKALRNQGLKQSAARMNAVNAALAAFKTKHGVYPASLSELNIETRTGMVCFPELRYERATPTSSFKGYELKVPATHGFMGFDSFFFWPGQTYPARIYGGWTEVIGAPGGSWAYVHE